MSASASRLRRPFRAIRSVVYLLRNGEADMVELYGRKPGGADNEALRLGSANIAAAISNPGGGSN